MTLLPSDYAETNETEYPNRVRTRLWVWIVIGLLFVIVGLSMPIWYDGRAEAPPTATPLPGTFRTVVLLGIDSAQAPAPQIEAVWLVLIAPDYETIELVGLSPVPFRNLYTPQVGLTSDVIQGYAKGEFEGTIIFDHADLAELADTLGGGWLDGAKLDGTSLVNYIVAADASRPNDELVRQAAVMQGLVAEMSIRDQDLNLADLLDIPSLRSVDETELHDILSHFSPVIMSKIRFRVYSGGP